jgi:hypothetical protein
MTHRTPNPAHITGWDRAAIVALGAAGCALSYDALQQMATAIHVRGPLTYLFPLVIDGFIAYGVRALLVLRAAPLAARCYVWLLFGTATAASIWANALHAVRLNQQHPDGAGLHLGDHTVGILSTLAPLALAGAVHLYILIARCAVSQDNRSGQPDIEAVRPHSDRPEPTVLGRSSVTTVQNVPPTDRVTPPGPTATTSRSGHRTTLTTDPSTRPAPTTADLLPLARHAVAETGRVTRQVVANAIRGQGLPLSNDRLTGLMEQLRAEHHQRSDTPIR